MARRTLLLALVLLVGCGGSGVARASAGTSTTAGRRSNLSDMVVQPADLPGWRVSAAAGRLTAVEQAQDAFVATCMRLRDTSGGVYQGATFLWGAAPHGEEVSSVATRYPTASTPVAIATSPRWAACAARSVHDQIATSRRLHVVGAVHTSVPVVDLSSRRARMQIQYALTDGHLTVTYVNEVVLLWRGPVAVTLYLDRQGGPMVAAARDHVIDRVAARL